MCLYKTLFHLTKEAKLIKFLRLSKCKQPYKNFAYIEQSIIGEITI